MAIPFDERPLSRLGPVQTPSRHGDGLIRAAHRFIAVVIGLCTLALISCWLISRLPIGWTAPRMQLFPFAFGVSSVLLLIGSVAMSRALHFVRLERQKEFRQSLFMALLVGGMFWGVQTYGLWTLMPHERTAQAAQSGVNAFVVMLAALHGMHFIVAALFLSYVAVRALADRYDHEYYWGVSVAAWFWHALGVVWVGILAVFAIAAA